MTFLADAHRAHLLIGSHRAALVANTCRPTALGADQHSVGDMDRHSLLDNASLGRPVLRAHMLLDKVETLNNDLVHLWHRPRDHALLPSILAGQNNDGIAFLNIHPGKVERLLLFLFYCHIFPLQVQGFLYLSLLPLSLSGWDGILPSSRSGRPRPFPDFLGLKLETYNTSGASEMIFMKLRSRSSRATGPKIRVPRGLLPAAIMTAAFSSKRICEPSGRTYSFATRTTTALTTSPFFTCPLGAACLTVALMMSPTSAYFLREPLITRIHIISFAPVLSATFKRVCG